MAHSDDFMCCLWVSWAHLPLLNVVLTDIQTSCGTHVAHCALCPRHGDNQHLLDPSSVVSLGISSRYVKEITDARYRIAVSIWFMEIFTVFLPCWEVLRHQTLCQETLNTIAQWENKTGPGRTIRSFKSKSTIVESIRTGWKSSRLSIKTSSVESILTLSALEYVLERNPEPLQKFSALRDFSGENIAFLTSVGEWKASFPASVRNRTSDLSEGTRRELIRERFSRALRIYTEYIRASDAAFPINISSVELKKLECIFEEPARSMYGERQTINPATPFNGPEWRKPGSVDSTAEASKSVSEKESVLSDYVQYWGNIPDDFDQTVFDDAEKSIKYLVLTNTWPKFVRDRRNSMESYENGRNNEAESPTCFQLPCKQ